MQRVKKLTAIDLFSGAGGLSVGLQRAGFRVGVAVELDPNAAESYRLNHRRTTVVQDDIRGVTGSRLLKLSGLAIGELDLLTGFNFYHVTLLTWQRYSKK